MTANLGLREEAEASLVRMQRFDVSHLPREGDLGSELNFADAVTPAQKLVDLYKRLSPTALQDFPDEALVQIRDQANADHKLLDQALTFKAAQQNPHNARTAIISSIASAYGPAFLRLHPYISYSLHRSADFQRLDQEARAALQGVEDRAAKVSQQLEAHERDAARVLEEIRKVAAEEGVTQQSIHFRSEGDHHESEAEKWRRLTIKLAWGLGVYAFLSMFLHKLPWLAPSSTYEAFQLGLSKVLIFAVITYMLYLSARNFLSHKHNSIVNRHRQNALMTHKALVEAASESGVREAIMVQAASCIFSPQSTGYTLGRAEGDAGSAKSIVEILSKPIASSAKESN